MTPDAIQEGPAACRPATAEEVELVEWASQARRNSLGTVSDALRQLVVLTTAVLGGSAALLNQVPVPAGFKAVAVVLLLGALGLALLGNMPLTARLHVNCPEDIRDESERGLLVKSRFLRAASAALFAAFAVLVLGLLVGLFR